MRPELQGQTTLRPVLVARPALKGRGCSLPAPRSVIANRKTSGVFVRQLPVDGERPQGRLLGNAPRPELQGQTTLRPILVARPALKGRGISMPAPRMRLPTGRCGVGTIAKCEVCFATVCVLAAKIPGAARRPQATKPRMPCHANHISSPCPRPPTRKQMSASSSSRITTRHFHARMNSTYPKRNTVCSAARPDREKRKRCCWKPFARRIFTQREAGGYAAAAANVSRARIFARRLFPPRRAARLYDSYNDSKHLVTWHNGRTTRFGHCAHENDIYQYQGAEYLFIGHRRAHAFHAEACGNFSPAAIGVPLPGSVPCMAGATNPGNIGHAWVKALWIDRRAPAGMDRPDQYDRE